MWIDQRIGITPTQGLGIGWSRVADALASRLDPGDVECIWLFTPVRREEREWGVAVISCRSDNLRRRIFTGSYMMITRGREKGRGKVAVDEVGESTATVLNDVLSGVRKRTGEAEPPIEISPATWFGDEESG